MKMRAGVYRAGLVCVVGIIAVLAYSIMLIPVATSTVTHDERIGFLSDVLELGDVRANTTVDREIVLNNGSSASLLLTPVSGCSCLKIAFDQITVQPGSQCKIPFTFRVGSSSGLFEKSVLVRCSWGTGTVDRNVQVRGRIIPVHGATVQPSVVHFGEVARGATLDQKVQVARTDFDGRLIEQLIVKKNVENWLSASVDKIGGQWVISVNGLFGDDPGFYNGIVQVVGEIEGGSDIEIKIPVDVRVMGDFISAPQQISLVAPAGKTVEAHIKIRRSKEREGDWRVKSTVAKTKSGDSEVVGNTEGDDMINLTIQVGNRISRGVVTVEVNEEQEITHEVAIPFIVVPSEK